MSDTTELVKLSAAEMAAKVKAGEVSSRELVEAHLAVIDAALRELPGVLTISPGPHYLALTITNYYSYVRAVAIVINHRTTPN